MFALAAPAIPSLNPTSAATIITALVVMGMLMLLWGRKIHRLFLAACGVTLGLLVLAEPLAEQLHLHLTVSRAVAAIVLAGAGFLLARVIWSVGAGAIFAWAATYVMLLVRLREKLEEPMAVTTDWSLYIRGWFDFWYSAVAAVWAKDSLMAVLVWTAAGGMVLVISMLRPRFASILMTSVVGGALMVAGGVIAGGLAQPVLWEASWRHWYVPLSVCTMLLAIGLVYQYRGALMADKAAAQKKEQAAAKEKSAETAKK